MINVIVELSKYIILTLMIVYTFHCFYTVRQSDEEDRNELLRQQLLLIFFIDFTAFLVLYLKTFNFKIVEFYAEMLLFFAAIQILYRLLYKKASILLLNNMCMLLSVGFIMLCRLDISSAQKQLLIAAGVSAIALVIPVMIRKMRFLRRLTWVYAGIGIILLAAVFALARTSYGAKLSLLGVQPSEAIKITFVFFMASFLSRDTSFKAIVQVTVVAALHVGIGTGGWFGMGLYQGSPESIPVVKNDFIFSAICEELGGIFAICLILVCMSFFLMIVNIALRIINPFYKLIALGLGVEYDLE